MQVLINLCFCGFQQPQSSLANERLIESNPSSQLVERFGLKCTPDSVRHKAHLQPRANA